METKGTSVSSHRNQTGFSASVIVAAKPISEVWIALGGDPPKHGRARAFYRDGTNQHAVSLSDAKAAWFDHRDGRGGGVLDLIQRVLGYNRTDALRWLSGLTGLALADSPLSAADRRRYARARWEAAEIVAWRERLTNAIKRERARWWGVHHFTKSYILEHGFDAALGEVMATLYEFSEEEVSRLQTWLDLLSGTPYSDLLPIFREQKSRCSA